MSAESEWSPDFRFCLLADPDGTCDGVEVFSDGNRLPGSVGQASGFLFSELGKQATKWFGLQTLGGMLLPNLVQDEGLNMLHVSSLQV